MSKNRPLYVLVIIGLVTMVALTAWQAYATKATVGPVSAVQGMNCRGEECSYQLPNGSWVR
ncbi:MAG TPA: hypothetical protein VHM28_05780 [Anaerolineales bacterium]|jgi:Tfp pilus assembly protein PilE|nr:hypothetical protein [Anaerolineales bacterium]